MNEHPIKSVLLSIVGWCLSWKVAEVQMLVGIFSGLIVAGFAATQWYVLWNDKFRKRKDPK